MATKSSPFKQHGLTPVQQLYHMQQSCPAFAVSRAGATMTWTGDLMPAAMCDTYTLRISYNYPSRPKVFVLAPQLRARPGERIPHMFDQKTLCLHLHEEWNPQKIIAHTVVHWAARWLYFYETWLITGHWEGGGHEPAK